jgi:hypothetical protein
MTTNSSARSVVPIVFPAFVAPRRVKDSSTSISFFHMVVPSLEIRAGRMIFMRCFHVMHTNAGGKTCTLQLSRRLKYLHSDSGGCLI